MKCKLKPIIDASCISIDFISQNVENKSRVIYKIKNLIYVSQEIKLGSIFLTCGLKEKFSSTFQQILSLLFIENQIVFK